MTITTREHVAAHIGNIVRSEVNKEADFDLEAWILERIDLRLGERVLDVGCGNGKQLTVFSDRVGASGYVTGADIFGKIPGLMDAARKNWPPKPTCCWSITTPAIVFRWSRALSIV